MMGVRLVERALAKVNLTLDVLGRRADGFHELSSLVAFAHHAFDIVEVRPGENPALSVIGPFAGAIAGDNILARLLRALDQAGIRPGAVTLDKRLPIASGIGGGSADAAALWRALRSANLQTDTQWWRQLADDLGADVPVCITARPAMMSGKGEHLAPIDPFPPLYALLAHPQTVVPADKTARVFRALGLTPSCDLATIPPAAPTFADTAGLLSFIACRDNRLTGPACTIVPAIADVLAELERLPGCRLVRMSGAGPTCFGLFDSMAAAEEAGADLAARQPGWWICPSALG